MKILEKREIEFKEPLKCPKEHIIGRDFEDFNDCKSCKDTHLNNWVFCKSERKRLTKKYGKPIM